MRLEDWCNKHTKTFGITVPPMTTTDAKDILAEEVLGKKWGISYPCNGEQEMAELVYSIVLEVRRLRMPWWKKLFA